MILKKPYAFLLKYFRVIHLVLTLLLIVCAYKIYAAVSFFNTYISNGYYATSTYNLQSIYTPGYLFILVFLILVISCAIYILMNHKKKPNKLYLFTIIYYTIIFLGLFYVSSVLGSFEQGLVASSLVRSIRDILIIVYLPQFIFIILVAIRTIGFDIKKFDFKSDLQEMNYSASDAEEFELNIKFEGYKAKRKARRAIRETMYYVKENKFIFTCMAMVLGVIIAFSILGAFTTNYDRNYGIGRTFLFNNLNITFEDSIVSSVDYNGNIIKNGKSYVVIKTKILNTSSISQKVDFNVFKLQIGNKLINPDLTISSKFVDYAPSETSAMYGTNTERIFALVYEINNKDASKKMQIKINNGTIKKDNHYINRYIYAKVKPKKVTNVSLNDNHKLGDIITFGDTFLGNTSIAANAISFLDRYIYKYESCSGNNCMMLSDAITLSLTGNKNTLLIIETAFSQDNVTLYSHTNTTLSSFVNNFIHIEYQIDGKMQKAISKNVTPSSINNIIAFEVPKEVQFSQVVDMVIIIRNQKYIINLKS